MIEAINYKSVRELLIEGNVITVYGIDRLIPIIQNINELKLNTLTIQQGYEENMFSDSGDVYYIKLDDNTLKHYRRAKEYDIL